MFQNKRLVFEAIAVLIVVAAMALWLIFHYERGEVKKEEAKTEESDEFQGKLERLHEVETAIEETKKELEALSTLSPEELEKREREREVLAAQKATDDVLVEGVEAKIVNKKKIIRNLKEGYKIEVPANLVIARSVASSRIELHDKKFMCQDPACEPIMRIRVREDNSKELSIGEWLAREEAKEGVSIYSPRNRLTIQGEEVYRVFEEIPARFEGYYYYFGHGKKIYDIRISIFDDEAYRSFIETFSFLTVP